MSRCWVRLVTYRSGVRLVLHTSKNASIPRNAERNAGFVRRLLRRAAPRLVPESLTFQEAMRSRAAPRRLSCCIPFCIRIVQDRTARFYSTCAVAPRMHCTALRPGAHRRRGRRRTLDAAADGDAPHGGPRDPPPPLPRRASQVPRGAQAVRREGTSTSDAHDVLSLVYSRAEGRAQYSAGSACAHELS